MAKLTGIRDSKGRFETFMKNNERRGPPARHQPVGHAADGSMGCSVCTGRYSPAAFAKHLTGAPMLDSDHGIYIAGLSDPFLARHQTAQQDKVTLDADAVRRAELIDLYYQERDRPKNRFAKDRGLPHAFFD